MDETERVHWLARRAAFAVGATELSGLVAQGSSAYLRRLVEPDAAGVAPSPDPFRDLAAPDTADPASVRASSDAFVGSWIEHFVATPRPLEEMMTWFWHDHFAVQTTVVRSGRLMADHVNLLRRHALGNFRTLVREVTTDAAMLLYLDGAKSTAQAPNENYGRELLELYTMGIGNYTEADVRAAAVALTGWTVRLAQQAAPTFVARLHDARPQAFLGRSVSDVDGVVNTAVDHPATARFIAGKLAVWFLGPDVPAALIEQFAATFRSANFELRPLVRAILQAGIDGAGSPVVRSPLVWWTAVRRLTGVAPNARNVAQLLNAAGQLPGAPPNVGGWPGMQAWLGASSTLARLTLATLAAESAANGSPALAAAAKADVDALASLLGLPRGFEPATRAALRTIGNCGRRAGSAALALALGSPDLLIA